MKNPLVALAITAALAGCAARSFPEAAFISSNSREHLQAVTAPAVGAEALAQVGGTMLKTFKIRNVPALDVKTSHREVTDYRDGMKMAVDIRPGTYEIVATDGNGGKYFRAPYGIALSYERFNEFRSPETVNGGIFIGRDGAKSAYWFWSGYTTATLLPTPAVQTSAKTVEKEPDTVFEREIIYTGSSQSTLTLLYREFVDNRARPAFAQELKYDLQRDRTIGFQGARIEIISAGNTGITYRVLSSWND
jgi:hypothetical protein